MRLDLWSVLAFVAALASHEAAASMQPLEDESDLQENFEELLEWLQMGVDDHGLGKYHPLLKDTFAIKQGEFGKALVSKRRIEKGTILALVPLQYLVTDRNYSVITGNKTVDNLLDTYTKVTIFLIHQKEFGEFSFLWPWLRMLPRGYKNLPKYWDQSFLRRHLGASRFTGAVAENRERVKNIFTSLFEGTDLAFVDFEWAWDVCHTRAMQSGSAAESKDGDDLPLLMPLLDLALHSDYPNVKYEWDSDLQALKATAVHRIFPGQEIYLNYIGGSSMNNVNVFQNWGFTSARLSVQKSCALLHVSPGDVRTQQIHVLGQWDTMLKVARPEAAGTWALSLCNDARAADGSKFLGYMRYLAHDGEVVGNPTEGFQFLDGQISDPPTATGATTWDIEAKALKIGLRIIDSESSKYRKAFREASSIQGSSDTSLHFLATIRYEEETALQWWYDFLTHALRHIPEDLQTPVDESYLERNWMDHVQKHALLTGMALRNEAKMTAGYLPEIILATFTMMAAADIICWALSRCPLNDVLLWKLRWPLLFATIVLLTFARLQDVYDVVETMAIPWIATTALYVSVTLTHLICIGDLRFDKAMLGDVATVASTDFKRLLWFLALFATVGGLCVCLVVRIQLLVA